MKIKGSGEWESGEEVRRKLETQQGVELEDELTILSILMYMWECVVGGQVGLIKGSQPPTAKGSRWLSSFRLACVCPIQTTS